MTYQNFKNIIYNWPVIFSKDLVSAKKNAQIIRNQLQRWQDKGLLIQLRRGVFLLNERERKINPSRLYIANQLYAPSYISMEYALSYYGLIPERTNDLTSITTKKTFSITNPAGTFNYQHIKPAAFRGFKVLKDEAGLSFFIAEPEKAIVDFLYLNLRKLNTCDEKVFEGSYRLQNTEILNRKKIAFYAGLFNNDKLKNIACMLCKFIYKEKTK
ncbi:MAG: hypothetical protein JW946_00045 [Candidatus Omnitrophica bacterium]|nr:hypothetical protein [Candidatus Omnitrophota bacterium]